MDMEKQKMQKNQLEFIAKAYIQISFSNHEIKTLKEAKKMFYQKLKGFEDINCKIMIMILE
jgi:hypothetical protein